MFHISIVLLLISIAKQQQQQQQQPGNVQPIETEGDTSIAFYTPFTVIDSCTTGKRDIFLSCLYLCIFGNAVRVTTVLFWCVSGQDAAEKHVQHVHREGLHSRGDQPASRDARRPR